IYSYTLRIFVHNHNTILWYYWHSVALAIGRVRFLILFRYPYLNKSNLTYFVFAIHKKQLTKYLIYKKVIILATDFTKCAYRCYFTKLHRVLFREITMLAVI